MSETFVPKSKKSESTPRPGADGAQVQTPGVEGLFDEKRSAARATERDWGEEAERDFADIIGRRFLPIWPSAVLCAMLGVTMHFVDPLGLGRVGAIAFAGVLFVWGLGLRRLSRPTVVLFWAAAVVAIIAFCLGLVVALDREDPLVAVLWSIGGAVVGWLTVMSFPASQQP